MTVSTVVVKVGGSLYDLPDLGPRLWRWLAELDAARVLVVPGGGPAADVIRAYDRTHQLGAEAAHWLALRMLSVNGHFLAQLLPDARLSAGDAASWPTDQRVHIIDMDTFARADEGRADALPHSWDVTSDSLAVRVAQRTDARRLILLKSIAWRGDNWQAAARARVVDAFFPEAVRRAAGLTVEVVDFRSQFEALR